MIEPHRAVTCARRDRVGGIANHEMCRAVAKPWNAGGGRRASPPMPRYFYHLRDEDGLTEDEEGLELPDAAAARRAAVRSARSLMAAQLMEGRLFLPASIAVEDASGAELFTIRFEEAVEIVRN